MHKSKKILGYARVSSKEQNLDRQISALVQYGVKEENIVVDKESGKDFNRPGWVALKSTLGLRTGDTLVVKSLDRLSRNKSDIKTELEWLKENNIRIIILDLPTTMVQVPEGQEWILDMVNNILIEVLASISEEERNMIRQRQREGILSARAKGKHLGRPRITKPQQWDEVINQWKQNQVTAKQAMKMLGLSSSTFYRLLKH